MTQSEQQASAERIKTITTDLSRLLTERGVEHYIQSASLGMVGHWIAVIENQTYGTTWNQHDRPELKICVRPPYKCGERAPTWRESVAGKGFPLEKIADFIKQCVDKANQANKEADELREQNNALRKLTDESKIRGSLQMEYGLCVLTLRGDPKIIGTLTAEKLRKIEEIWKGEEK